jgi:N-acetylglutamate synthase-like GNAT family acetyltransferase
MGDRDALLRRAEVSDETAILALFRAVFGRERSADHWRWKFAETPYPNRQISLAVAKQGGALLGHYAVVPVPLNWMGRRILGAESVDTMVHPDARGLGLFEQLGTDCYARLRELGVGLVYGLPNRNSYPGFLRKLGWKRIGFLDSYTLRLSVREPLRRILRSGALAWLGDRVFRAALAARLAAENALLRRSLRRKVAFRAAGRAPAGCDALWEALRSYEVISLWKDRTYLEWRYDRHPSRRFEYCWLEQDGQIEALAVVETGHATEVRLCELLTRRRDAGVGRLLVNEIARRHRRSGRRWLSFAGMDAGFFAAVFAGFCAEPNFELVFGARAFGDPALDEMLSRRENWTVTRGDTDLV